MHTDGLRLVVAHLDHQLRPESAAEAHRVADHAREWRLPVVTRTVDVRALAAAGGRTLEEAAREARYRFFAEAAAEHRCSHVAAAHTANDQAETVLLHLLRGTGLSGLAGMPADRPLGPSPDSPRLVRPLLAVPRAAILAYCEAHGLAPSRDPSNESFEFTRNRIRGELLPHLAERYNPRIVEGLARLAGTVRGEVELRDALAEELLAVATVPAGAMAGVRLDLRRLRERPPALRLAALRLAFARCAGGTALDHAATGRLRQLLLHGGAAAVDLVEGWTVWKSRDLLAIGRTHDWRAQRLENQPLPVPGSVELLALAHRMTAEVQPAPARLPPPRDVAYLDAETVRGELVVRGRLPGDRMRPLGMEGAKKVSNILSDARVLAPDRGFVPLVADEEKVLWVVGHAIHHDARITPATTRVLALRMEPLVL